MSSTKRRGAHQAAERRKTRRADRGVGRSRCNREPENEIDRLLEDPNGLANANPVMAELVASATLGWSADELEPGESEKEETLALIEGLGARGRRNELAILHAMISMLYLEEAEHARRAIDAIRARGHADPPWAGAVAHPAFVDAWARTDDFGDITVAMLAFQHEGWPPHVIDLVMDHTFLMIREAQLSKASEVGPTAWQPDLVPPPRRISAVDASALLWPGGLGLRHRDVLHPDVPVDDNAVAMWPLLFARQRVLQHPPYVRSQRLVKAARRELVREFLAAAWPDETSSALSRSPRFRTARQVAGALVDFAADTGPEDPLRCTPVTLEECLIHELPRELGPTLDPDHVLDVLRRWIDFTGARSARDTALTGRLVDALDALAARLRTILEFERSAERSLTAAMHADGVDTADQEAVAQWLDRFDRLSRRKQERILGMVP